VISLRILVTGGAGCIGSELIRKLLERNDEVIVYDNFSTGKKEHLREFASNRNLYVIEADILDSKKLFRHMRGVDVVYHFAANSTVKFKEGDPTEPILIDNVIGTHNVLEAMRRKNVKEVIFASTSAVYGDTPQIPSTEQAPLMPISMYGATKAAGEHLIQTYCDLFKMKCWIFRFANVVGGKSRKSGTTVLPDFINKLKKNPKELEILGNGLQKKSYMTVDDCIDAMLFCYEKAKEKINIFNLGTGDTITVNEIADVIVCEMGLGDVKYKYTGGDRGWPGDMPLAILDIQKLTSLGWKVRHKSKDSVITSVRDALGKGR
jgi:UDP-glucose 4-epimerase